MMSEKKLWISAILAAITDIEEGACISKAEFKRLLTLNDYCLTGLQKIQINKHRARLGALCWVRSSSQADQSFQWVCDVLEINPKTALSRIEKKIASGASFYE